MPNTVLPGFIYINWLIPINPLVATIIIPIFVDKETEAHRGQLTYPSGGSPAPESFLFIIIISWMSTWMNKYYQLNTFSKEIYSSYFQIHYSLNLSVYFFFPLNNILHHFFFQFPHR